MELTINGQVYQFNFGMGFMREMNKKVSMPVDGVKDAKKNIGLRYAVAGIMDGDVEALEDLLLVANKGQNPRATTEILDEYIDDCLKNDTDIEFIKEKVVKYAKYIGSLNEAIYLTRIDAIQMFENA